ncbi:MlaD family protein [Rhodococcus sp. B50]|uniref:MlaD family protein n=1 Tax=Rhodococcus sp. B50 TaxID=2682847 RepID=UPI001BD366E1|nr:MlaD family protein [Rhodococcus sp. B50]MBS9374135.1 Lipoprotein LprN [Rhodococcus sp. B50]
MTRAHTTRTRRARTAVAMIVASLLGTTACSVGLESLPLPEPGVGGESYLLHATFENALNLPTKAKVKLAGADVGEVASMRVEEYSAIVTMRIADDVSVPVGTAAELRSATPLGDVFVSLQPPADTMGGAVLAPGDTIPLSSTAAAATIEEVLSTASILVNGGALRNFTKIIGGLGEAVGDRGDRLGVLVDESTRLAGLITARTAEIEESLTRTDRLIETLAERRSTIDEVMLAAGPALDVVAADTAQLLDLVGQVDRIGRQMERFPSVQGTDTRSTLADLDRIAEQLNAAATHPEASLPSVNRLLAPIMRVTNSTSANVDADLEQLVIGAVPAPGHSGDPGSRLPDETDWQAFVGTLTYTLMRLQKRLDGEGP